MSFVKVKCPSCGANVDLDATGEYGYCAYCGTKIVRDKIVVEHRGEVSVNGIATKEAMTYNLIHESWINAVYDDGEETFIGLKQLFRDAHHIVDIKTPPSFGTRFPLYDYLILRLCCGIFGDAYSGKSTLEEVYTKQQFDVSPESILGGYFIRYENRFDLFDNEHPFLQSGAEDMKDWHANWEQKINDDETPARKTIEELFAPDPSKILMANPCAPAESARICELKVTNAESFSEAIGSKYKGVLFSRIPDDIKKSQLQTAIVDSYKLTPREYALILLYENCLFTAVGSGNIAGLSSKAYFAAVYTRRNLFDAILYNSTTLINDDLGIPQWRWEGTRYAYCEDFVLSPLSGLFFPTKLVNAKVDDNGYVSSMIRTTFKTENIGEILEAMKIRWIEEFEPHFVTTAQTDTKEKAKRQYSKIQENSVIWLGALSLTKLTTPSENDVAPDVMYYKPPLDTKAGDLLADQYKELLDDTVRLTLYYRTATAKWVYRTSGVVSYVVPNTLNNSSAQSLLKRIATLAYHAIRATDKSITEYYKEKSKFRLTENVLAEACDTANDMPEYQNLTTKILSDAIENKLGMQGQKNGILARLANAKDDSDTIWKEYGDYIAAAVSKTFDSLYRTSNIERFFICKNLLMDYIEKRRSTIL